MASLTVTVHEAMAAWIESRFEAGAYVDTGDYLRDLVRRDQADAPEGEALSAALAEGEASGISERGVLDTLAAIRQEHRGDAA